MKRLLLSMMLLALAASSTLGQTITVTLSTNNGTPPLAVPSNGIQFSGTVNIQGGSGTGNIVAYVQSMGAANPTQIGIVGQVVNWVGNNPPTFDASISYSIDQSYLSSGTGKTFVQFEPGIVSYKSNDIDLAVTGIYNNVITAPSPSVFVVSGDPGVITGSTPSGGTTYAYQWQSSSNGTTYANIAGNGQARDYDPPVVSASTWYRRIVTSPSMSSSPSNFVKISVTAGLLHNSISGSGTLNFGAAGGDPTVITGTVPSGGSGSYTYRWQKSLIGTDASFQTISGATLVNYDPPAITQTTYYRRIAMSGSLTGTSNVVPIRVIVPITSNTIWYGGPTSFNDSGDPPNISGSTPAGGGDSYVYKWEFSGSSSSGFSTIPGATSQSYDPAIISETLYYRRVVSSAYLPTVTSTSNVIKIKVDKTGATIDNPILVEDVGLCGGFGGSQGVTPAWDDDPDQYVDVFYKFNLTALGRISLSTCRSDGTANGASILNAGGVPVSGVPDEYLCDVGGIVNYDNLPIGTYYVVMSADIQSQTWMQFDLRLWPILTVSNDALITLGSSTTLTASGVPGATYTWSPSAGLNITTGSSVIASPLVSTNYRVTATVPAGCNVDDYVSVLVSGSVGSTFEAPIVANIEGCGYTSQYMTSDLYGNEYQGTAYADVYFKFTLSSASIVEIDPYNYNGTFGYYDEMQLSLLNSSGILIQQKNYGWVYNGTDEDFPYEYKPLDLIYFRPNLAAGTYYVVVEGTNGNVSFALGLQTPAGHNCRLAAPDVPPIMKAAAIKSESQQGLVYPNPANQTVSIQFDEKVSVPITIFDITGRVLKAGVVQNSELIDVGDLPPGFYAVKIIIQGKEITRKLVIRR